MARSVVTKCRRLLSLCKWEPEQERGVPVPLRPPGASSSSLVPSPAIPEVRADDVPLPRAHFWLLLFFHFRALPGSLWLLLRVLQQLQESREQLGRAVGARAQSDNRRRRESCCSGSVRALRGSAELPRPHSSVPASQRAKQRCSPQHSPKGLGMCFPGNQGEGGVGNPFRAAFI